MMNLHPQVMKFPAWKPGRENGPFFQFVLRHCLAGVDVEVSPFFDPLVSGNVVEHACKKTAHIVVKHGRPLMPRLCEAQPHPWLTQLAATLEVEERSMIATSIPLPAGNYARRKARRSGLDLLPSPDGVTTPGENAVRMGIYEGSGESGSSGKAVDE